MPINSKAKGKRGELELATILRSHGWTDAKRGVQYKGGADSPDVEGIPGVHFERKRVRGLQIYPSVAQAKAEARHGDIAVVAFRGNGVGKAELAILTLEDFLGLLKKAGYGPQLEWEFKET